MSGPGRICFLLALVGFALLALSPRASYAGLEEEADRQIQLAEEDLAAGNYERAAASAASALRLDPGRHEAFVIRGLALQGLGRLEDAAGLLRAYLDLRGTLPADERVAPALAEIEQLLTGSDGEDEAADPEQEPVVGRALVFYGPDADDGAAEAAYTAAQPYLGSEPAAGILALGTLLPRGAQLVVEGAGLTLCEEAPRGTLQEQLAAAESALTELELEAAVAAADGAERHLACGDATATQPDRSRLLAARAQIHWLSGEPEGATWAWSELFALDPSWKLDTDLSPEAQALQLDAKTRGARQLERAALVFAPPVGWTAWLDGVVVDGVTASPRVGRRTVRLVGPDGETVGAVLALPRRGGQVLVGTGDGLRAAIYSTSPPPAVLGWLGRLLSPQMAEDDAKIALVVNVSADPATVRRFDGRTFLVVSPGGKGRPTRAHASRPGSAPAPGSVVLLGGGLAATALGVILAAVAHGQGAATLDGMGSVAGYSDGWAAYEAARTQEQVGMGLAIGGGVVAAVGGVTFAIPSTTKVKVQQEAAAR